MSTHSAPDFLFSKQNNSNPFIPQNEPLQSESTVRINNNPFLNNNSPGRVALPEKFNGDPTKLNGFIVQCAIYIAANPNAYQYPMEKVSLIASLLKDDAADWLYRYVNSVELRNITYEGFIEQLRNQFDNSTTKFEAARELYYLHHSELGQVNKFIAEFQKIAPKTDWNESALINIFVLKLHPTLQTLYLTIEPQPTDALTAINAAKRLDDLCILKINNAPTSKNPFSQMPLYSTTQTYNTNKNTIENAPFKRITIDGRLTPEERERRITNNLCLFCGMKGHSVATCLKLQQKQPKN